jgi:hypothetical protein
MTSCIIFSVLVTATYSPDILLTIEKMDSVAHFYPQLYSFSSIDNLNLSFLAPLRLSQEILLFCIRV